MRNLTENQIIKIVEDLHKESIDDVVGLWQVIGFVHECLGDESVLREPSLDVVRGLLAKGLLAGDPPYSAGGYQPWSDQDPEAVIDRIRREWLALGRTPNIPDIVWFAREGKY